MMRRMPQYVGILVFCLFLLLYFSNLILSQEPVLSIETLCLLAIYAQAAGLHDAAYLYVSTCS